MKRRSIMYWLLFAAVLGAQLGVQALEAQTQPKKASSTTADAPPFIDSIDVDVINVEVFVTDKNGDPVTGLRAEDFELKESGDVVEISNFYAVEDGERLSFAIHSAEGVVSAASPPLPAEPALMVVYVDDSLLEVFSRTRVLRQLRGFLKERQEEGMHIMVARYDGVRTHLLTPFTTEQHLLDEAVDEMLDAAGFLVSRDDEYRRVIDEMLQIEALVTGGAARTTAPCPAEMMIPGRSYIQSKHVEVRRSIEHLEDLIDKLAGYPGRKAMVHVSDGLPQVPGMEIHEFMYRYCGGGGVADGLGSARDSRTTFSETMAHLAHLDALEYDLSSDLEDLTDRANAEQVTFYMFEGYGPRPVPPSDGRVAWQQVEQQRVANLQNGLFFLAHETGGRAFLNFTDFSNPFQRMNEDLGTYYSLGYSSQHGDEREHQIKVKVPGKDVRVRHRRSSRVKSRAEEITARTNGALTFDLVDNPLGVEIEVGAPQPMDDSLHVVPIRVDIPIGSLAFLPQPGDAGNVHKGHVTVYLAARDRRGRTAPVRTAAVPIAIPEKDFERAREQRYLYEVKMLMRPGDHSVAVGVHDDFGMSASYLLEDVLIVDEVGR